MKNLKIYFICCFITLSLGANDNNLDKLDILDKQSKEFFKAITGLEKEYIEEQISIIKNKKEESSNQVKNLNSTAIDNLSQEEYEKNVFKHQNELAKITTDFTKTKRLKDLKIKSMYSFNDKDYVVLRLDEETAKNEIKSEVTSNIEGRYIKGDYILGHLITNVNVRTKSLELFKKIDEEYGYFIYLNNYGINVSELIKKDKIEIKKEVKEKIDTKKEDVIKEVAHKFQSNQVNTKEKKEIIECLYNVNFYNLNVRNQPDLNATILRVLKQNDQFTIKQSFGDWVQIDTIYKKASGDVMVVENQNNWLNIIDNNVSLIGSNCN